MNWGIFRMRYFFIRIKENESDIMVFMVFILVLFRFLFDVVSERVSVVDVDIIVIFYSFFGIKV